jgi:hypothetical protein
MPLIPRRAAWGFSGWVEYAKLIRDLLPRASAQDEWLKIK